MQIRQQVRVLQTMCQTVDIKDIHNSIKPVISKVKTGELADDEEERYIEDFRQIFTDACEAEIEMMRNKDLAKDSEIDGINNTGEADGGAEGKEQEIMRKDAEHSKEKKYEEMTQFYEKLSNKLVIFDPLDREILNDDEEDMATKRDQLIQEIQEMEQLNPKDLDIMISPEN